MHPTAAEFIQLIVVFTLGFFGAFCIALFFLWLLGMCGVKWAERGMLYLTAISLAFYAGTLFCLALHFFIILPLTGKV